LPEGRFKEFLRSYLRRGYGNWCIYRINKIISKLELLPDDTLLVELNDGARFCVPRTEFIPIEIRYGDPQKLGKIEGIEHFDCWGELYRQYVIGTYEKKYKFKEGDIVVDAGTHIGVFTVKSSRAVGSEGKVIAIEPEPNNLSFLQRNIEANGLKNVVVVPRGLWGQKGRLKLYLSECLARHSFWAQWAGSDESMEIEVDTLDDILRELGIKRVDFIKMNIEGAEVEALKGMEETLNNDVKLAIAAHHSVNGKPTYETIQWQLKQKGFEIYTTKETIYGWRK